MIFRHSAPNSYIYRGMEDYYFGGGTQFIDISYLVPLGESNVLRTYLRESKS